MFAAWGRFVYRRRWPVLAVSGLLLLISIFVVIQGGKLQSGGFIETSESGRASRLIERDQRRRRDDPRRHLQLSRYQRAIPRLLGQS